MRIGTFFIFILIQDEVCSQCRDALSWRAAGGSPALSSQAGSSWREDSLQVAQNGCQRLA